MTTPTLTGAFTALVTPFTRSGDLDEAGFLRLLDRQIGAGIDGLVPCGTTGETPTLDSSERDRIIELTIQAVRDHAAGQRIRVISEPHNLDAIYFLMARKFVRSRTDGTRTALTLKEDGMWVMDAHPHKNKHRRGKNSLPGKIIDVSGGAQ